MSEYRHILFATDLSPESESVATRAIDLAQRYQARLTLVHVVEHLPVDLPTDIVLPERMEMGEYLVETSRERLTALAERIGVSDAQRLVELGSPKAEITRVAEEQGVDLIVVGSHGRHGLELLLGSTANGVLHAAKCDVLAVRVKE
jgi:universal stress protein A